MSLEKDHLAIEDDFSAGGPEPCRCLWQLESRIDMGSSKLTCCRIDLSTNVSVATPPRGLNG